MCVQSCVCYHLAIAQSFQIWTPADRKSLLDNLSTLIVKPSCSEDVAAAFPALMLEMLSLAKDHVAPQGKLQWLRHQRLAIALGRLIDRSTDAKR